MTESAATHIRLICWDRKHVQVISPEQLRSIVIAPICSAPWGDGICGQPIWAVDHEGEPRRYVGRPPHANWSSWADCIPQPPTSPSHSGGSE